MLKKAFKVSENDQQKGEDLTDRKQKVKVTSIRMSSHSLVRFPSNDEIRKKKGRISSYTQAARNPSRSLVPTD